KGTLVGTLPSTAPRTRPEVAPDTDTAVKGVQPHGRPSTCAVGTEQEERTELPSGGRVRGGSGPAYGPGRGDLLPGALQPLHPGCGRIHRHHRPDARTGGPPAGLGRLRADPAPAPGRGHVVQRAWPARRQYRRARPRARPGRATRPAPMGDRPERTPLGGGAAAFSGRLQGVDRRPWKYRALRRAAP